MTRSRLRMRPLLTYEKFDAEYGFDPPLPASMANDNIECVRIRAQKLALPSLYNVTDDSPLLIAIQSFERRGGIERSRHSGSLEGRGANLLCPALVTACLHFSE